MCGKYIPPQNDNTAQANSADAAVMRRVQSIFSIVLSVLFAFAGIAVSALVIHLCNAYHDKDPILLTPPDAANVQLTAMMDAVCDGDFKLASSYILDSPELGVQEPADALGVILWDALLDTMEYDLTGQCYTTDMGLAQDLTFTYLDPTSVTANLRTRSQTLLEQRVAEAEDVAEIYDENNNYREDFVMDILFEAAQDALREDSKTVTVVLTVNLKYQDGQWWIIADTNLLDAISGGVLF